MACSDERPPATTAMRTRGSRRGVVVVVAVWSSWPTVSVTTNGLAFVPSMSWSSTSPSWPGSVTVWGSS